ncbi:MAG: class I SAM-dependent methyltransferase [Oscillospiraceae bacterium]|nr:class I SAM-dependent methyltransferase [Oscillospiraceae bacterium]
MSYQYRAGPDLIEQVLRELKDHCYVPEDAAFVHGTLDSPNRAIYYNDYSFLDALGYYQSENILNDAVAMLKKEGMIKGDYEAPHHMFDMYAYIVKNSFVVPWKSFTPTMERLVYAVSLYKKPRRILSVGVNCGYTQAWIMGHLWKSEQDDGNVYYALEKNPSLLHIAKKNLDGLRLPCASHYIKGDASEVLDTLTETDFDMIFLDTRRDIGILHKLYGKLAKGGWLLMHNASDPHFTVEMKPYLDFVRDLSHFEASMLFAVDAKGLELSIK